MKQKTVWKIIVDMAIPIALFFILQLLCVAVLTASLYLYHNISGKPMVGFNSILNITMIVSSVLSAFLVMLYRWFRKAKIKSEMNPVRLQWKWSPLMIVATIAGMFCANVLNEHLNLDNIIEDQMMDLALSPIGILSIAVLGPIAEECVFRCGVLGGLLDNGIRSWVAIVVSALLFGIIHLNPAQIPYAFIIGVLLGILYVKTRSIIPSIICHILNNAYAVITMNIFSDNPDITIEETIGSAGITYTLTGISLIICVISYYYYIRKR